MGKRVVKNYPSPRLMQTIGATNQSAPEAIGELVANCFDARYQDEKMVITIDLRNENIVVVDNGKGMTSEILEKAVCIAEDMSQHLERGEGAKGHFGMGFKTSCATLGNYYEIFTRPVEEDIELHTAFDISDYGTRPSGADAWDVVIEDSTPSPASPLGNADHGTAFVVSRLKDKHIFVSAVLKYLGEAFKAHIISGDRITVIDEAGQNDAVPERDHFISGSKIEIDETFGPDGKYHITGWMALDSQTHNDGLYGFNIYRNSQLVMVHDKSWFRAHLMTSRVIGEVNMDFLDATFYKQGVQQSEDWKIVKAHMKEYLKSLVKASDNLSKNQNVHKTSERKRIIGELRQSYGIESEYLDDETGNSADQKSDGSPDLPSQEKVSAKPDVPVVTHKIKSIDIVSEEALVLENEGEIKIIYLEEESGDINTSPFDYIFDDEKSELIVIIKKKHPLWTKKVDNEVREIVATSDAIYRLLVEKIDYDTSKALRIRNEWVTKRTEGLK